jgi:hypothetical protein
MAGKAKYTIMIPTTDNLGQPLVDIATAAHRVMFYGPLQIQGSYVDPGKHGNWRDSDPEPHDLLVTIAEDTPEMDSHVKQIALEVGEFANQWGIFVVKEGKDGITDWVVDNPRYQDGQGAEPTALAQPAPVPQQGVAPPQPPAGQQMALEGTQPPPEGQLGMPLARYLASWAPWRLSS